ncbi:MAG: hypothetical protein KGH62_01525, partial [Candidatus Micrarchaeota archaeon]|nr:hypothetical protein [Candidatus Micrarchaeota archaeon]
INFSENFTSCGINATYKSSNTFFKVNSVPCVNKQINISYNQKLLIPYINDTVKGPNPLQIFVNQTLFNIAYDNIVSSKCGVGANATLSENQTVGNTIIPTNITICTQLLNGSKLAAVPILAFAIQNQKLDRAQDMIQNLSFNNSKLELNNSGLKHALDANTQGNQNVLYLVEVLGTVIFVSMVVRWKMTQDAKKAIRQRRGEQ